MSKKVERNYLEINSVNDLIDKNSVEEKYSIELLKQPDFQINKFFYKQIGKKHHWVDRLVWTEKQWISYVSNRNVNTYVLKDTNELAGYFELIFHREKNEVEIAYLGLLEHYINQKLGSYLYSIVKNTNIEERIFRIPEPN